MMQEFNEMALKYPDSTDSFQQFLVECGFNITDIETKTGHSCFRLSNGAVVSLYQTGTLLVQGVPQAKLEVETVINERLGIAPAQQPITATAPHVESAKKIFIVHGHDHTAKEQLELILHKLGLPDHFILQNTGGTGLTIIEELEREIGQGQRETRFGIVLLTPDDMGYSKRDGETNVQARARQNVVLEMGMLLSSLGRSKVVILQKRHLEQPSDAAGILYLNFNDHVRETVPKLIQRLRQAGFTFSEMQVASASS